MHFADVNEDVIENGPTRMNMVWWFEMALCVLMTGRLWAPQVVGLRLKGMKTFVTDSDYDDSVLWGIPSTSVTVRDVMQCSAECSTQSWCKAMAFGRPSRGCPTCLLYRDNICTNLRAYLHAQKGYRIYDVVQCDLATGQCDLTCVHTLSTCLQTAELGCPQCGRTNARGSLCQIPQSGCPKDFVYLRGVCYQVVSKIDSRSALEANWNSSPFTGTRMAKLRDWTTANFLQQMMSSPDYTFVGLSTDRPKGTWLWPDGSVASSGYVDWSSGQPDFQPESMVQMWPPSYSWNDVPSYRKGFFVCETPAVGNSSTCPPGYVLNPETDKCYRLSVVQQYGKDVKEECNRSGTFLAMVKSKEDHSFLMELIANSTIIPQDAGVFIGLEYVNGHWTYSNGSLLIANGFSTWLRKQPDMMRELCTAVNDSELYDVHCGAEFQYLLEWIPLDCSGWRMQGHDKSGSFKILASRKSQELDVFCDMQDERGGWTVIESQLLPSASDKVRGQVTPLNDSFVFDVQTLSVMTAAQTMEVKVGFYRNGSMTTVRFGEFNVTVVQDQYKCSVQNITDTSVILPARLFAILSGSVTLPCIGSSGPCLPRRPFGLGPNTDDFEWISYKIRPLPNGT